MIRPYQFRQFELVRLTTRAPDAPPRPHPRHAHHPTVLAQAKHLIETTILPYRAVAARVGVNGGTIARCVEKHGWTRPPGASIRWGRPERRFQPVMIGRALAQRLRVQAERLVTDIEAAREVDPVAL